MRLDSSMASGVRASIGLVIFLGCGYPQPPSTPKPSPSSKARPSSSASITEPSIDAGSDQPDVAGDGGGVDAVSNRHGQQIPRRYEGCFTALDHLADQNAYFDFFSAQRSKTIDVDKVHVNVGEDGIEFTDVNGNGPSGVLPWKSLEHQLMDRTGQAFTRLTHLGHIYAEAGNQYSGLSFEELGDKLRINVGSFYVLTFEVTSSHCLLKKIDYVKVQEE